MTFKSEACCYNSKVVSHVEVTVPSYFSSSEEDIIVLHSSSSSPPLRPLGLGAAVVLYLRLGPPNPFQGTYNPQLCRVPISLHASSKAYHRGVTQRQGANEREKEIKRKGEERREKKSKYHMKKFADTVDVSYRWTYETTPILLSNED